MSITRLARPPQDLDSFLGRKWLESLVAQNNNLNDVLDISFLVLGADSRLPNARSIISSTNIFYTDTGPGGNLSFDLTASGVTPGTYTQLTVDAKGRVTNGGAAGFEVPLTFNTPLSRVINTISLSTTGVTPGSYSAPDITIDAWGRITVATTSAGYIKLDGSSTTSAVIPFEFGLSIPSSDSFGAAIILDQDDANTRSLSFNLANNRVTLTNPETGGKTKIHGQNRVEVTTATKAMTLFESATSFFSFDINFTGTTYIFDPNVTLTGGATTADGAKIILGGDSNCYIKGDSGVGGIEIAAQGGAGFTQMYFRSSSLMEFDALTSARWSADGGNYVLEMSSAGIIFTCFGGQPLQITGNLKLDSFFPGNSLAYVDGSKIVNPVTVSSPLSFAAGVLSFTVPGADTQFIFNDGGSLAGNAGLTFNKTNIQAVLEKNAIGATQSDAYGFRLQNTTAAASGAPQYSPPLIFEGEGYRTGGGAGVKPTKWMIYNETASGAGTTLAAAMHNTLLIQRSYAGAAYSTIGRFRGDTEGPNGLGFDVIGAAGPVTNRTYLFSVQNNDTNVDMAFITSTFAVEGTGFFSASTDTFQIYATEGGGIEFYPDTGESLQAFAMRSEGDLTLTSSSIVGKATLTIVQADQDQPFIKYDGTSAADATKNVSTRNGDGTVEGPKNFLTTAGWAFVGMVRVNVEGTDYWMPYYSVDTA